MHQQIKNFLNFLDSQGYLYNTIVNYERGVLLFSAYLELLDKDFISCSMSDIENRKGSLKVQNRTKNLYIHAIRKLYFWLDLEGYDVIDFNKILLTREGPHKETDYITRSEVLEILDTIEEGIDQREVCRNRLIIRLLRETGLRVSELANLTWRSINYSTNSISVIGKGGKERTVFLSYECKRDLMLRKAESCEFIGDYIIGGLSPNNLGGKMSRAGIELIIRKLNHTNKKITPHSFRHGMATHILWNGGNIVDISKMLGHSNLSTTSTYLHSERTRIKKIQEICWFSGATA